MPVILAGCAASTDSGPRSALHFLTETEMDRITFGEARAMSSASAQATGRTASTSTSDISSASSSPIKGAPFLGYATSQSQAVAHGESAQADGAAEIGVGSTTLGVATKVTSSAKVTGENASAVVNIQVYGVSITNHTSAVFGTVDASACCGFQTSAQTTIDTSAEGLYVTVLQAHRTEHNSVAAESAIDFAEVSSVLPTIDPSRLAAARFLPLH